MSKFAKRLQQIREAKGLSLYRLAKETGLSMQGVINLEADGSDPKLSTLLMIAKALDVWPWELLPGWPESTSVDQSHSRREQHSASAPKQESSGLEHPGKTPRQVDKERSAKKKQAAERRWLNNLKKKMAQDARSYNPDYAIRPGESDAEWAHRLVKLDLQRVHPATKPDLHSLFRKHGVPSPFEYVPPPPAPPTPRAAYSGPPDLEALARTCEPYLRHAWMWTEKGDVAWCSYDLHMDVLILADLIAPPLLGKSTLVDQRVKAILPTLKDLAENLRPNRQHWRAGQNPCYRASKCQEIIRGVFDALELTPSGMTTEESGEYHRQRDRIWKKHRQQKGQ